MMSMLWMLKKIKDLVLAWITNKRLLQKSLQISMEQKNL